MQHIILPGLTTTPRSDWRGKVEEIIRFDIREIALFPTFLKIDERRELYVLLEKTDMEKIPHVHLRDDMEEWELDLFTEKYGAEVFNMHDNSEAEKFIRKTKYKDRIYIENCKRLGKNFEELVKKAAGICLDVSHAEDFLGVQRIEGYDKEIFGFMKKYAVGCSHVSAIKKDYTISYHYQTGENIKAYSDHQMAKLDELEYVGKYVDYLPEYVSLELENPFEVQLRAKEYLEKIINK